jgi:hypothetical protein
MRFHQMLTDSEPNSAATTSTGTGFIHPVKTLEDMGNLVGREANACVGDGNQ